MKQITVIDTLYVYAPIQTAEYFYHNYVKTDKVDFLGVSAGREWYKDGENRIGICSEEKAKTMNTHCTLIQYSKKNCHNQDFNSYCSSLSSNGYSVQRVDLAVIFQKENFKIEPFVISPFKSKSTIGSSESIETMYLGKRSCGKVLRIYNKSLEIEVNEDYQQMDMLSQSFDNLENLYTCEVELHRSFIMDKFGDVTVRSLSNLLSYSSTVIGSIVFFENTPENISHYKHKNYDRINNAFSLASTDEFFIVTHKKLREKPSLANLCQRVNKTVSTYIEKLKIEDNSSLMHIYSVVFYSILHHDKFMLHNLEFDVIDLEKEKSDFIDKMDMIRKNVNDGELMYQAEKAFSKLTLREE